PLRDRLTRALALATAVTIIGTLFVGSEQLGKQTLFPAPYLDKVAHAGCFGTITLLLAHGLAARSAQLRKKTTMAAESA
ncbi:MAG: hypothetical protein ACXVY8_05425, partial [Gaiellaceae bacterium]